MIRPCDACGGVYYDGEPCRFCQRLESARRWSARWKAQCKQYAWRFEVMHRTGQALLRQAEENAYLRGIEATRRVAVQAVRMLQAVRDGQPVAGLMHDESAWDTALIAPLERAIENWEEMP